MRESSKKANLSSYKEHQERNKEYTLIFNNVYKLKNENSGEVLRENENEH